MWKQHPPPCSIYYIIIKSYNQAVNVEEKSVIAQSQGGCPEVSQGERGVLIWSRSGTLILYQGVMIIWWSDLVQVWYAHPIPGRHDNLVIRSGPGLVRSSYTRAS